MTDLEPVGYDSMGAPLYPWQVTDILEDRGIPTDHAETMVSSYTEHGAQQYNAPMRAVLASVRARLAQDTE